MKLILFDIDGTLVSVSRDVSRRVVAGMLRDVLGHADAAPHLEMHGKTDRQIMFELCDAIGHERAHVESRLGQLEESLLENWRRHLVPEAVTVLPGVRALLDTLSRRDDVCLGLLTGNLAESARLKLGVHDLHEYFRVGAYGSDAIDRADLPPIAIDRASGLDGHTFTAESTLIIGDSHRDIACARANGVRSLAVATGALTSDELRRHEPTWVCESLLDDSCIFEFLDPAS